ncbi:serine/threonine-protein kinase [Alteromonas stellipolaris]|uniref:serine/threonine-protein kinase n=1 Tax=Alteromonas stellipolaris TaxID=233316 RepID=UPI002735A86A|nr:protein kinase [Alteromonas stellipolaris]MDP2594486.1 protein kinase [Alteromonas stellipolaris]
MKFENALLFFQHLIGLDEAKMRENLSQSCPKEAPIFAETLALIDAHYANQQRSGFTQLVGAQADLLCNDNHAKSLEGSQVGPYLLKKKLGHGGMGAVYLGQRNDGLIEQKVAIKFVYSSIADLAGDNFIQREAQHLANLNHPNIAKIYTIDVTEEDIPYLVMEYIEGAPLSEAPLLKKESLSGSTSAHLTILIKLCSALFEAHQSGIIHADIKPSNIIVDENNQPKLLDFGISHSLNHPDNQQLTAVSNHFASPQQQCGDQAKVTDDIYALGKVMAFMFQHHTTNAEFEAVIQKATSSDPKERFQSAEQFNDALECLLANRPLKWFKSSKPYYYKKWFQRSPATALSALIIPCVLVLGAAALFIQNKSLIQESKKTQQTLSFYDELFLAHSPQSEGGGALSAADFINHGVDIAFSTSLSDSETRASIVATLSQALLNLGYVEKAKYVIERLDTDDASGALMQAKIAYYSGDVNGAMQWLTKHNNDYPSTFESEFLKAQIEYAETQSSQVLDTLANLLNKFDKQMLPEDKFRLQKFQWEILLRHEPATLLTRVEEPLPSDTPTHQKAWFEGMKSLALAKTGDMNSAAARMKSSLALGEQAYNATNPELAQLYGYLLETAALIDDPLVVEFLLSKQQSIYLALTPLFENQLIKVYEQQHNYYAYGKMYAQSVSFIESAVALCEQQSHCARLKLKQAIALYLVNDFTSALSVIKAAEIKAPKNNDGASNENLAASFSFFFSLVALNSEIGLGSAVKQADIQALAAKDTLGEHTAYIIHTALRAGFTDLAIEYGLTHTQNDDIERHLALASAYAVKGEKQKADEMLATSSSLPISKEYGDTLASILPPEVLIAPDFKTLHMVVLEGQNRLVSNRRVAGVTAPTHGDNLKMGTPFTFKWNKDALKGESISLYINHKLNFEAKAFDSFENIQGLRWQMFAKQVPNTGEVEIDPFFLMANGGQGFKVMMVSDQGYWSLSDGSFGVLNGTAIDNGITHSINPRLLVDAISKPEASEVYNVGERNTIEWDNAALKGDAVGIYVLHDNPINIGNGRNAQITTVLKRRWYLVTSRTPNSGEYGLDPAQFNGQGNAYKILIISDSGYWAVSDERFTVVNPH